MYASPRIVWNSASPRIIEALKWPTQVLIQGQWWSIFMTQRPHLRQWWDRGALYPSHWPQCCSCARASSDSGLQPIGIKPGPWLRALVKWYSVKLEKPEARDPEAKNVTIDKLTYLQENTEVKRSPQVDLAGGHNIEVQ